MLNRITWREGEQYAHLTQSSPPNGLLLTSSKPLRPSAVNCSCVALAASSNGRNHPALAQSLRKLSSLVASLIVKGRQGSEQMRSNRAGERRGPHMFVAAINIRQLKTNTTSTKSCTVLRLFPGTSTDLLCSSLFQPSQPQQGHEDTDATVQERQMPSLSQYKRASLTPQACQLGP